MTRAKTNRPRAKPPRPPGARASTQGGRGRAASVDESMTDRVERQPSDAEDRATLRRMPSLDESGLRIEESEVVEVTELPAVQQLRIAVHEGPAQLPSAQGAIAAAGHSVLAGASGAAGLDSLREHLSTADALLVALPGGEPLVDAALALAPGRPIVIASCAGSATEAIERAARAGADLVAVRPHDVDRLAPILFAAARLADERRRSLHARGNESMMRGRLEQLADADPGGLQPFERFRYVLELELKRAKRYAYALAVALFAVDIPPPPPPAGVRGILRARAGNAIVHAIRDIDLATELDHERFLVLLPYTDLSGAAEVARRVIAQVASGDPVIAGGRTFPPGVVGAVAGGRPGEPLSFARLMRDATQALEQARRDGATLAVQP